MSNFFFFLRTKVLSFPDTISQLDLISTNINAPSTSKQKHVNAVGQKGRILHFQKSEIIAKKHCICCTQREGQQDM